jgi:hypothetical protein
VRRMWVRYRQLTATWSYARAGAWHPVPLPAASSGSPHLGPRCAVPASLAAAAAAAGAAAASWRFEQKHDGARAVVGIDRGDLHLQSDAHSQKHSRRVSVCDGFVCLRCFPPWSDAPPEGISGPSPMPSNTSTPASQHAHPQPASTHPADDHRAVWLQDAKAVLAQVHVVAQHAGGDA